MGRAARVSLSEPLRRVLASLLLAILAVSTAGTLSFRDLARRAKFLGRAIAGREPALAETSGFWFDRNFADFLEDVRRRTPRNATVAVIAPERPDVYTYQAVYRLAPRRVVAADRVDEAGWVAAYGHRGGGGAKATPVAHGTLFRR